MSSAYVAPAQVDRRAGYFYVTTNLTNSSGNAVQVDTTLPLNAIMTSTELTAATGTLASTISAGAILRDMGKQITIVDATTGLHTQVWRRVQVVTNGATTEGINNTAAAVDIYVLTWAATGSTISVVRTG